MSDFFKVVGIGNAIIDIFSFVDDEFLIKNHIEKGVMNLISLERSNYLSQILKVENRVAGGSAANTIVGLSQLGIKSLYLGSVSNDVLGNFFISDLNSNSVNFNLNTNNIKKLKTGHSFILVTPDGERSMNTYLGITEYFSKDNLNDRALKNCHLLYLEGYRYDGIESQIAFELAIKKTKIGGGKVALSLSDPFCVERHRKKFLDIINNGVDIVFCNEKELISLTKSKDLNSALVKSNDYLCNFICTLAEKGVILKKDGSWVNLPTDNVKIVDTTGAGDLFATGFLYGILNGYDVEKSAFFANKCAGEIIKILGCRLEIGKLASLL